MKLFHVQTANSTWLFDTADLNPSGKSLYPALFVWLQKRYHFATIPESFDSLDESKGLAFKQGVFHHDNKSTSFNLTIYGDGLLIKSTASTRDNDTFMDDLLVGATEQFGLSYNPAMIRSKWYLSELVVEINHPFASLNPKLQAFCDKLNGFCASLDVPEIKARPFGVGGIALWRDTSQLQYKAANFALERRIDVPFTENRYFSKAPLHTHQHLELLTDFEKILTP